MKRNDERMTTGK